VTDVEGQSLTTFRRVRSRTINLERISKINDLSRGLKSRLLCYQDAISILDNIARERTSFSLGSSMVASGMIGGTTVVVQNGSFFAVCGAFLAAFIIRYVAHVVSRRHGVQLSIDFLGAMVGAFIGASIHKVWPDVSRDAIIIGAIMPLVPGMVITNAIRDFIAGDLVSGISRGMEAMMTAAAVAMGVVIILAVQG
jgi:uncharacterized membrane protein YjjP (DUF1212 family)